MQMIIIGKSCLLLLILILLNGCLPIERKTDFYSVTLRNSSDGKISMISIFGGYSETVLVPNGSVGDIALYGVDPGTIFLFPKELTHLEINRQDGQKLTLNRDQMRCICEIYPHGKGCVIVLTAEMFGKPPEATCQKQPAHGAK